jgi:FxsC-like protein
MRYFFLSHSHQAQGSDRLVTEVFEDLCLRVRLATGSDRHEPVGFVSRCDHLRPPLGEAISRELARCKVLVPLYSPRYFASTECGQVVSAFCDRNARTTGAAAPPIVPLLWIPPNRSWPPVPVLPIEVADVERYDRDGLFEVMLSRGEAEADHCYDAVLDELARLVVDLAGSVALPVTESIDAQPFASAFARTAPPPRVSIHVLAPDLSRLPVGRDQDQYGATPLHWSPYRQEASEGLGSHIENAAQHLGYRPTLTSVDDVELDVYGRDPPSGPAILLIDPWALEQGKWRDQLQEFDRQDRPWVTVMAAWNRDDPQTARVRQHLFDQLNTTLDRRYRSRRPGLHLDADIAASLSDIARVLPSVLQESTRRYLRWISR